MQALILGRDVLAVVAQFAMSAGGTFVFCLFHCVAHESRYVRS